jgi:dTDP-4-dehydrorhamnose reductase
MITGAHGQLGKALQRVLSHHDVSDLGPPDLDVTDPNCIDAWFKSDQPQYVVHCAALTDTAACERFPESARAINADGTANIARAARSVGAPLLAVSTNEVFDGSTAHPTDEAADPRPLNEYGRSKLLGEISAREVANTRIVRTAWLYGDGDNNFVAKVLRAGRTGKPLRFVTDEVATPTYVDDLAVAIRQLIERDAPGGIYHLTNEGEASRYEWACEILRLAGMGDVPVEPITTEQLYASGYDGPRKPPYSVLANTRARAFGITMRHWREALADYFAKSRVAADA